MCRGTRFDARRVGPVVPNGAIDQAWGLATRHSRYPVGFRTRCDAHRWPSLRIVCRAQPPLLRSSGKTFVSKLCASPPGKSADSRLICCGTFGSNNPSHADMPENDYGDRNISNSPSEISCTSKLSLGKPVVSLAWPKHWLRPGLLQPASTGARADTTSWLGPKVERGGISKTTEIRPIFRQSPP